MAILFISAAKAPALKKQNFRKRDVLVFDIFTSFQKNVQKGPFLCFFEFF